MSLAAPLLTSSPDSFPRMSGDEPFYEKPPLDWD